ncbi:Site-specific recombinase XerD [Lachnospiraceae bacterium KHCPX20]|nr:Site-specific recombinase XerD [Lachnospiraceae bacterium KHCPX20]
MAEKRKDSKGRNLRTGETQKSDGRYMYRYYDANHDRKTIYSWDLSELREKEKQIERDLQDGILTGTKITLNQMYSKYIESKTELKESTRNSYMYIYEHFVRDGLGNRNISTIKYSDIKRFYNMLINEKGIKANTVDNIHTILHPIFTIAVRDGIIRTNPTDNVMAEVKKSHNYVKPRRRALTIEEQTTLVEFLRQSEQYHHYRNLVTVFLGTGCRVGEIIGLRWEDIDLENNVISINHNCVYMTRKVYKCKLHITTPKTKAGCREIPILSEVRKALLDEKQFQWEEGISNKEEIDGYSGFVFCSKTGRTLLPSSINFMLEKIRLACNEWEKERAKKENRQPVEIEHFCVHQLRHTFCTRFCENETNVKVIQEIMGHSDIGVTMNIYAEATRDKKKEAFESLEGKIRIS